MNFSSDNVTGASQRVLDALIAANTDAAPAYGQDAWSARAAAMLSDVFACGIDVFLVATGTAANALALSALTPPWGAVFCHAEAHVMDDECGAPEMFTNGAKLVGIPGEGGKITPDGLRATLARHPRGVVKTVQPAALSLSQATEAGTLYTPDEIAALADLAHAAGVGVHMDGARFANAVEALGCTPAELTWKAGIDVLSFGATKNGALACEAVIFFDRARAADFAFRRKRSGHTLSKGRLLGAQLCAYLADDHWRENARHANVQARRLAEGLAALSGVRLAWPVAVNEVFPVMPGSMDAALRAEGFTYYPWQSDAVAPALAPREGEAFVRLVTSFATRSEDVDRLLSVAAQAVS